MKLYEVKFQTKGDRKKFERNTTMDSYSAEGVLASHKKRAIVAAETKDSIRAMIGHAATEENFCFGEEGVDYTIKKVVDDVLDLRPEEKKEEPEPEFNDEGPDLD